MTYIHIKLYINTQHSPTKREVQCVDKAQIQERCERNVWSEEKAVNLETREDPVDAKERKGEKRPSQIS